MNAAQVKTSVDMLMGNPTGHQRLLKLCRSDQLANKLEAKQMRHSSSSPKDSSGATPEKGLHGTAAHDDGCLEGHMAAEQLEEVEALVKAELKQLTDACAKSLQEATRLLQDVMQVEVKRLPKTP